MALSLFRSPPRVFNHWWSQIKVRLQKKKGWNEMLDETFQLHTTQTNSIPLFFAAKQNNKGCINKLLRCASTNIFERGALGETALHIAVMNDNVEATMALINGAPELINEPMTSELFQGITPLHIAVLNQNITLVQQLISGGACVTAPRATGLYWKRVGGLMYYGEHILSFAACTGNWEIISMVISAGASTRIQDSCGNTLLHILVLQPSGTIACQIIDLVLTCDAEIDQPVPLDTVPNDCGLTPLKLAAKEGNIVVFQYLVNKRHVVQWTLGTVSSNLYDLTEIDSWADELSVLELIVRSHKREVRKLLDVTPVRQLVSLKWNLYGKHYFRLLLLFYLLYIGSFTLCCLFRPLKNITWNITDLDRTILIQKPLNESYVTYQDSMRLTGEIMSVLGAFAILFLEVSDILRVGTKNYFGQTAIGGPFYIMFISFSVLVLLLCVFRVGGLNGEEVLMAISLVLGWSNVLFYARGFEMLGPCVVMIQKIILQDLTKFMWLCLIMLTAYSTALWVVYMTQAPGVYEYSTFPKTLWSEFELITNLINLPEDQSIVTPPTIYVLEVAFSLSVYILMLNLLISMMSDTYARVTQEKDELWKTQVVATTLMLERRLPRCLWPRLGVRGLSCRLRECWYLRVEDRNDAKMHHIFQAFSKVKNVQEKEEYQKPVPTKAGSPKLRAKTKDGSNNNRKSLIRWQIIRDSALGLDPEQERAEEDQGIRYV